ncbi:helix-turn-helix domain-containing protein [Rosenbergiella australiborealis]|uniref:helix-turn-helix domain-containing protein n=1 Tax=Rosenbergiella australiborealis TaxID=1544696 RepID=UPI001F4D89FE|nr:helix-turn-helix transcriptional regulator [Rosenbergiella australiborealis]
MTDLSVIGKDETAQSSNYSTIMLMVLKEIRLERGIHQGVLAQSAGKSASAWTKIENGQSPLSMDTMFAVCSSLQLLPSYVLTLTEKLISIFNYHGYYFQSGMVEESENELLKLMLKYFNSKGYEYLKTRPYDRVSITTVGYPFGTNSDPTIVRYCYDQNFRNWIDNGC